MHAINVENHENSLSTGSKKRLDGFRRGLASDKTGRIFDYQMLSVLEEYVRDADNLNDVVKYLANDCFDQDGYAFSQSLKLYKTYEKAYDYFAEEDYTSFRWNQNYQKALKDLKKLFAQDHLTALRYTSDEDIINAVPKVSTHSGWTWIETGFKTKGENMENIFKKWRDAKNTAIRVGSFEKPILPGVRTQCSGAFDEEGNFTHTCKHKARLVSMVDLMVILAELKFAKPFQKVLGNKEFYAGAKDPHGIGSIIWDCRVRFANYLSLDYSRFDQSISSWLIEDAFSVIKSCFQGLSDEDELLWDIVVRDFIQKNFVTPSGYLHSKKGVPSGSMFTQIIDSLVNWIMITTYLYSKGVKGQMLIMGDDNLLFVDHIITADDIASYLKKNFGVIVNPDKTTVGSTSRDPEFLSRTWTRHGQWRDPNVLISKLLYPERRRSYDGFSPEIVLYSYILAYDLGMQELINTAKFKTKFNFEPSILKSVDSRNLPGYFQYLLQYQKMTSPG